MPRLARVGMGAARERGLFLVEGALPRCCPPPPGHQETTQACFPKVTATVASLKDMLQAKMGGKIPLNKFQLKHDVRGFVKDRQTFADLNFRTEVELHVHLKTRKRPKPTATDIVRYVAKFAK